MIKAIAIDDEPLALELISRFCSKHAAIQLEKTFTKPSAALAYLQKFPVDLVFLDIQMPSVTGLALSKNLPKNVRIIFTTAFSEHALDAYELNAIDYLLKPFEESRFSKAVDKAVEFFRLKNQNENPADNFLFIRADYKLIKIPLAEILYIEGLGDYLKVHYGDNKLVVARMTMKNILAKLTPNEFLRVHRSFIVPFSRIENVRNKTIYIKEQEIPIGTSYENDFFKKFKA
ncbi:MAG: LytR/AlgR family response regulator transcription factor [Sphingobacteriaceae bacterium]